MARLWRSRSAAVSPGLPGTASGILAPMPPPASRLSQRSRMSCAVRSQICRAHSQPTTGATIAARRYQAQKPVNGSLTMKITATAATATISAVNSAAMRLFSW